MVVVVVVIVVMPIVMMPIVMVMVVMMMVVMMIVILSHHNRVFFSRGSCVPVVLCAQNVLGIRNGVQQLSK